MYFKRALKKLAHDVNKATIIIGIVCKAKIIYLIWMSE